MSYSGENEVKHVGIQYAGAIHLLRWPQLKIESIDLFDPELDNKTINVGFIAFVCNHFIQIIPMCLKDKTITLLYQMYASTPYIY